MPHAPRRRALCGRTRPAHAVRRDLRDQHHAGSRNGPRPVERGRLHPRHARGRRPARAPPLPRLSLRPLHQGHRRRPEGALRLLHVAQACARAGKAQRAAVSLQSAAASRRLEPALPRVRSLQAQCREEREVERGRVLRRGPWSLRRVSFAAQRLRRRARERPARGWRRGRLACARSRRRARRLPPDGRAKA